MNLVFGMLICFSHLLGKRNGFTVGLFKSSMTSTISFHKTICMTSNLATVVLEKGKAKLFQGGNPIIYGGAVKEVIGDPQAGDECLITDHMSNPIGKGVFNPFSQYRVRVLVRNYEKNLFEKSIYEILKSRINDAINLRASIGLPNQNTTVYRLVNGEGDRLGGLIIDIIGNNIIIQSSALWVEKHRKTIEDVIKISFDMVNYRMIWRRVDSRLKQDGWVESPEASQDFPPSTKKSKDLSEPVKSWFVRENGVEVVVDPEDGQKTGFYCDQRNNRLLIRRLSEGKKVLDAYCYTGGFSINAALGGASQVVAVDSSGTAINAAIANAKLNNIPSEKISFVKTDCVDYFRDAQREGLTFDLVICDPPKLAPTRTALERAKTKYLQINSLAMSLLRPGGLMLTFSCSAAVTQSNTLPDIIQEAAVLARRDCTILQKVSAGEDHPVHVGYPEGSYLSGLLLRVL